MEGTRVAVVTGAGSGLGRELALKLASRGHRVFGTAMDQAEVDDLATASGGAVALVVADITRGDHVQRLADAVARESDAVDLLISNAGILTPGPLEVVPLDAVRREFEVNVFGALAVINAFLPALRTAKGRIVQVSSVSVDMPMPFNGLSAASKAAMDVFATVYRAELAQFGIDVTVVVPGSMRTGGPAKTAAALQRVSADMSDEQQTLYGAPFATFESLLNAAQGAGLAADDAADQVIAVAEQRPAPPRVPIGEDAVAILELIDSTTLEEQDDRRVAAITPTP